MQTCRSRPSCEHAGQGFHLTAYSFAEKFRKALYQSSYLKGICRFLCRIGALLPELNTYEASSQADKRCRYSKQAMINQLMNVSVIRGFDGVVEELANITLMFYQAEYKAAEKKETSNQASGEAEDFPKMEPVSFLKDEPEKKYGYLMRTMSDQNTGRSFVHVSNLSAKHEGKEVWVRARVHNTRAKGNNCFLVLRQSGSTVQGALFKDDDTPKEMIKFAGSLAKDIKGLIVKVTE